MLLRAEDLWRSLNPSHVKFIARNILLEEIDYARGNRGGFNLIGDDEWAQCAYTFEDELCVKSFPCFQLKLSRFVVHSFSLETF